MRIISNCKINLGGALMLTSLLLAASCATHQETQPTPAVAPPPVAMPAPVAPPARQSRARPSGAVRASFQDDKMAGHLTASGEPYDPDDFTAASKTLPIGSTVLVTNPKTGKSVRVRINDRGPHVRGRSLDLSRRAAEELGITGNGVARLKVQRVDSRPARSKSTVAPEESVSASVR
jgi:rare lipoprotein A